MMMMMTMTTSLPVGDDTNIITQYNFIYESKTYTSEQLESQRWNVLQSQPLSLQAAWPVRRSN